jgi:hypothetical protein
MQPVACGSGHDESMVAFLGVADRATNVADGQPAIPQWHILGLRNILFTYILPIPLGAVSLVFAIRFSRDDKKIRLLINTEDGDEIGWVDISPSSEEIENQDTSKVIYCFHTPQVWSIFAFSMNGDTPVLTKPGRYIITKHNEGASKIVGEFYCIIAEPLPFTIESVAAIKNNPMAAKSMRLTLGCRFCESKLKVYTALEKAPPSKADGFLWYQDIPDEFACGCGKTKFDTTYVKRNLFALLANRNAVSGETSCIPLYEKSALEKLASQFSNLLTNHSAEEEVIQKSIEKNPIILHQFPAIKFLLKPAILTRYKADFGIVTPQKELILIEIEPANLPLLRKDGSQHARLTHAIEQVRSWLHEFNEHRLAALDCLNLSKEMVSRVRGVVIAGRDENADPGALRRLKGSDHGSVVLLTYDDLLSSLHSLAKKLGNL